MRYFVLALSFIVINFNNLFGQPSDNRILSTAVPFLAFTPDARAGGLGDVGVATSPDAYSIHWNNGKLAFLDQTIGVALSYTPWLSNITNDMFIGYATAYYKIDSTQTVAASLKHFDLGEFEINDDAGSYVANFNSYETAIDLTYSRKLSSKIGLGLTGRYIRSDIPGQFALLEDLQPGKTIAFDLGVYYQNEISIAKKSANLSFGFHLSNFGKKLSYDGGAQQYFIPTNLRLGAAIRTKIKLDHQVMLAVDMNKLLVPTPPIKGINEQGELVITEGEDPNRNLLSGIWGSFSDAPDGFREELQEISLSFGVEYAYKSKLFLRMGYFHEHENKGGWKYLTFGSGFKLLKFAVDFSYLVPTVENHPLSNTLRLSLGLDLL